MRLHRLIARNFAGIREVEVEFGPGLTVLYGPNELGKSSLVEAIRMALLLPHTSTQSEPFVGWTGGEDPVVELTFETGPQRIWMVRKQFGKSGSALLRESKNGRDFDDVERGRKVDARIREILPWGIPEPGGVGGGRGLPASFLATALLPAQADVAALLGESLRTDASNSGRERIAAALQAVGQDPRFTELLRETQARRDRAYTDKGAKKTAKGSVFKDAAERVNETRGEKERLKRIVDESEGAEKRLRDLTAERDRKQERLAAAGERVADLELMARQAKDCAAAAELVRAAEEEVLRIRKMGTDVDSQERHVGHLVGKKARAEAALRDAQAKLTEAEGGLKRAVEAGLTASSDPGLSDTVLRQGMEIRRVKVEQSEAEARKSMEAAAEARKLAQAVSSLEGELQGHLTKGGDAAESARLAAAKEEAANAELGQCDLLERALEARAAERQASEAQTLVGQEMALRARMDAALREWGKATETRASLVVPSAGELPPLRRLSTEVAAARGALDVGFVVTVSPRFRMDLGVRRDGNQADSTLTADPLEIEAGGEVEIEISGIATVQVRGGRREAQAKARALEERWSLEAAPRLAAAGVNDLDGLEAKCAQARDLDSAIERWRAEAASLEAQMAPLAGAADALRQARERVEACRAGLGKVRLESLAVELKALGSDPWAGLKKRRQKAGKDLELARGAARDALTVKTLTEERASNARSALALAVSKRDEALTAFPDGVEAALAGANATLSAGMLERERLKTESEALERTIEDGKKRADAALTGARATVEEWTLAVARARDELSAAIAAQASEEGRLVEMRRLQDAENPAQAEKRYHDAADRHAKLPVPARVVSEMEAAAARQHADEIRAALESADREILEAQGALKQVGGAVARERLREATEALEIAERNEREVEMEYEAWKLLLEQMKEADAAQASNLGQSLAPAVASRFQELTRKRYENVRLTAQLGTEGVVAGGAVRSTDRISVGTREQLSTLYRLALAEYLQTAIVLDDQLVQSDDSRMGWFRELLAEKCRGFQIVVLTCRPGDYLAAKAMAKAGDGARKDSDGGFTRAIDLSRALARR